MSETAHELDGRDEYGLRVRLYYSPQSPDTLALSYVDTREGDAFLAFVPASAASDALGHPNAYRGLAVTLPERGTTEPLDPTLASEHYVAEYGDMLAPIPVDAMPGTVLDLLRFWTANEEREE